MWLTGEVGCTSAVPDWLAAADGRRGVVADRDDWLSRVVDPRNAKPADEPGARGQKQALHKLVSRISQHKSAGRKQSLDSPMFWDTRT